MKILQFMASEGYGGAEKVFVEVASGLAERHTVQALTIRGCPFQSRFSEKVQVRQLRSNPTRHNPLLHIELLQAIRAFRPDIIHTHSAKAAELVRKVNRLLRVPHLGTKHNDRKGRVFNRMVWVSTVSRKALASIQPARGARLSVIYNGVAPEPVDSREPGACFTLVAVGRLDAIKGFDKLVRQVALLDFPFMLMIVGDGPERSALEQLIGEMNLEEKVTLTGFREDVAQIMADAHTVVISSAREGGPKVLIESLHYAKMLISTPVGAVPEVLGATFLCDQSDLAQKITDVYKRYDVYRADFMAAAEKRREYFLLPAIIQQYEQLYREVVAAG